MEMRKALWGALIAVIAFGAFACDEAKKIYVEGEIGTGVSGGDDIAFEGTLGQGGTDYYGTCSYSDNKFAFEVGTSAPSAIDSTAEIYIKVTGVQGPPQEGVYSDTDADPWDLNDDGEYAFGSMEVRTGVTAYEFSQSEAGENSCYFDMFATPKPAEVSREGLQQFNYYVSIRCSGLSDITSDDVPLNSVNGFFFFANCE
jgi:hypothetical protein